MASFAHCSFRVVGFMFSCAWRLFPFMAALTGGICWYLFNVGGMAMDLAFFPGNSGGLRQIWIYVGVETFSANTPPLRGWRRDGIDLHVFFIASLTCCHIGLIGRARLWRDIACTRK